MPAVLERVDEAATTRNVVMRYTSAATPSTSTLKDTLPAREDNLEINRHIRLTRRDSEIFLALLYSDEEPNDALRQAAEEYNRKHR